MVRVLLGLVLLVAPARADVLVVDRSGAGQFTEIQPAVDFAQDGDTILVRVPTSVAHYAAFEVSGKALTIAADSDTAFAGVRHIRVHDLPAGKTVVLSRLKANYQGGGIPPGPPSIQLDNNQGDVRLVGCATRGMYYYASPGLAVDSSSGTVAWARCEISGGGGADGDEADGQSGGLGLWIRDAVAGSFDTEIDGGSGGDVYIGDDPGAGGSGAQLDRLAAGTALVAQNTTIRGGTGGDDQDGFGSSCEGAAGGTGLVIGAATLVSLLDSAFLGGPGGHFACDFPPGGGTNGPDGVPLVNSGTLMSPNSRHAALSAPTVAREGQAIALEVAANPRDQVFLIHGSGAAFQRARGGLLVLQPASIEPIGTADASGALTWPIALPLLDPGEQARDLWLQVCVRHTNGAVTIGSFAVVTVLDSAF